MKLAIIAAIGRNKVIGLNGKLPWHIPEDLKRFKFLTTGHTVLMGRRTFDSIGKPLSNRRNMVLTSTDIPGVETYRSTQEALNAVRSDELVFVIGGASLYGKFLDTAHILYLTHVEQSPEGDAFFPPYEHLIGSLFKMAIEEHHSGFTFATYKRDMRS